jgi:hypothetical protein
MYQNNVVHPCTNEYMKAGSVVCFEFLSLKTAGDPYCFCLDSLIESSGTYVHTKGFFSMAYKLLIARAVSVNFRALGRIRVRAL